VFATIQERQLHASRLESASLRDSIEVLESDQPQREVEHLREALRAVREAAEASAARGSVDGDEALRRQDVLSKLLDQFSVFEIEIAGRLEETGIVLNRCCYRTDPFASSWQSCGDIPVDPPSRVAWESEGAGGLVESLRRTKGGNAMAIVRQDEVATYRISGKLETLLRERFVDHKIYDDGVVAHGLACDL
jgi:hypothetical protein